MICYGKPVGITMILVMLARWSVAAGQPAPAKFQVVGRGDVTQALVERGEVEAAQTAEVSCKVRAPHDRTHTVASTIQWLIDDGTLVKKGDVICQLDAAALKEQLTNQRIAVASAKAASVQADANLRVVDTQNKADLLTAESEVELAALEAKNQPEADRGERRKFEIKVQQARLALEIARLQDGPKEIVQARIKIAEGDLELAELELKKHPDGAAERQQRLELKLRQAKFAVEIVKHQAAGKLAEAEARQQSLKQLVGVEEAKQRELEQDIAHCIITASQDGMVLYYSGEQSRTGGARAVIAVGEPVREGQRLMRLADLRHFQVKMKVHEARVAQLRWGDRGKGQPARIKLAGREQPVTGHVRSVSPVASSADWASSDIKVYPAVVAMDDAVEGLKPGMSAEVAILLAERKNVLRVPVQAVLRVGAEAFCYVKAGADVALRKVSTGLSGDQFVEIKDGLREGEQVSLTPLSHRLDGDAKPGGDQ